MPGWIRPDRDGVVRGYGWCNECSKYVRRQVSVVGTH